MRILRRLVVLALPVAACLSVSAEPKVLNVLFIGNSYTARHNLVKVVKELAEVGDPDLTFNPTSVIYGGRRLVDHWRLGSQNVVNLHALKREDVEASIASLEAGLKKDPKDSYAKSALTRNRELLKETGKSHSKWDVIVLQSYRDDLEGDKSLYAQYAPRFAELAKAQGARVILYETTPTTQNAEPLEAALARESVVEKANAIARLADRVGAGVAPMSLVGLRCQTERPDFTLRFVNDAHLNQTMAYLSACAIYAAIFEKTPVGLPVDSITDIRYFNNDPKQKDKDRDGKPIRREFSPRDRADLQRIAWEGWTEFQALRRPVKN
jgi:hypothetical protein